MLFGFDVVRGKIRFRGFTAPASLKGAALPTGGGTAFPGFRGFTAPASLKGAALPTGGGTAFPGFRGFTAPASLKVRPSHRMASPSMEFPGLYRPGLIEGRALATPSLGVAAFPGLYRPGLIEGWEKPSFVLLQWPVSGALPPRPH